jgi:hypothetical protein
MAIAVIGIAVLISLYEIPKMWKVNMKREIVVFSVILVVATSLFILEAYEVETPSPLQGVLTLFKPVGTWIVSLFGKVGG